MISLFLMVFAACGRGTSLVLILHAKSGLGSHSSITWKSGFVRFLQIWCFCFWVISVISTNLVVVFSSRRNSWGFHSKTQQIMGQNHGTITVPLCGLAHSCNFGTNSVLRNRRGADRRLESAVASRCFIHKNGKCMEMLAEYWQFFWGITKSNRIYPLPVILQTLRPPKNQQSGSFCY